MSIYNTQPFTQIDVFGDPVGTFGDCVGNIKPELFLQTCYESVYPTRFLNLIKTLKDYHPNNIAYAFKNKHTYWSLELYFYSNRLDLYNIKIDNIVELLKEHVDFKVDTTSIYNEEFYRNKDMIKGNESPAIYIYSFPLPANLVVDEVYIFVGERHPQPSCFGQWSWESYVIDSNLDVFTENSYLCADLEATNQDVHEFKSYLLKNIPNLKDKHMYQLYLDDPLRLWPEGPSVHSYTYASKQQDLYGLYFGNVTINKLLEFMESYKFPSNVYRYFNLFKSKMKSQYFSPVIDFKIVNDEIEVKNFQFQTTI
jgi:hypothetical protein